MPFQNFLSDLMLETISNGYLLLEEERRMVRFRLFTEECSVSGLLCSRPDWSDERGRPGLMPVIDEVVLIEGESRTTVPQPSDNMVDVYDVLRERLSPEKLYTKDDELGWLLTSFKSKPLCEAQEKVA
ncbi:hypothetical protein [Falsiruegeria mediterranea]|uniref:Uncharacterized protein n=1 Tax=Falsiruegeria mediterranea M17 TaxID=1200281 RepID=A0A2R8CAE6_9RHOB|nr:hypothetical protein [Falsiruegeria mediterranea]SPJ29409.1 hypothetical protein TRM7615_02927 [Falsiruegeria mediterranea M17]